MADQQRISYFPLEDMTAEMRAEMERCAREGTPRPESSAVRAHVPAAFWFFANSWNDLFRNGVLDHALKELCRVYISRTVKCDYCGNQRSEQGRSQGLVEGQYDELLNFESSDRFDDRQKAALAYAEAIAWRMDTDDAFWDRLHAHFSEPELVELGCMIGLTLGQQSWLRLLNIDHHEVMPGTTRRWRPATSSRRADPHAARRRRARRGPPRDGVARARPGPPRAGSRPRPSSASARPPTSSATGRTRPRAACARAAPASPASSSRTSRTRSSRRSCAGSRRRCGAPASRACSPTPTTTSSARRR